ncbi:hypothetical protein B0H11DRAFT_2270378 [Mycena galericulata]|nr:hypothetical protein B0H11DRAFT_2270378 [Mycena galericulata]
MYSLMHKISPISVAASYVLGIQELLDYTIDCLSESPSELLSCALVAKSWASRS